MRPKIEVWVDSSWEDSPELRSLREGTRFHVRLIGGDAELSPSPDVIFSPRAIGAQLFEPFALKSTARIVETLSEADERRRAAYSVA